MSNFTAKLQAAERSNKTLLCVGLDPLMDRFAPSLQAGAEPVFEFCRRIVDATADLVLAYKPQFAHFAAADALPDLKKIIDYIHANTAIPVILDAKRGDIGSTAERYAQEAFRVFEADAVTVNPYLGTDSLQPFLEYADKGVIVLCRTSNPGGEELQNLTLASGERLFERVATMAATQWNQHGNVMLVAGATNPDELGRIRELVGDMTLLIPGIGAQGGDARAMINAAHGGGVIVSSSRAVLYASSAEDFADAARAEAQRTRSELNTHLYQVSNDLRA